MGWFKNLFRKKRLVLNTYQANDDPEYLWSERDKLEVPEKYVGKMSLEQWQAFVDQQIDLERNCELEPVPDDYEFQPDDVGSVLEVDGRIEEKFLWIRRGEKIEEVLKQRGYNPRQDH